MAIYTVETVSGSVYMINTEYGIWSRNGSNFERISTFKLASRPTVLPWLDPDEEVWVSAEVPRVGVKMYLSSRDTWMVSSVVTSVDEKP